MRDKIYKEFRDPTKKFYEVEHRAFCYDVATSFIMKARRKAKGKWLTHDSTVKGILLLLFAWNSAARVTKKLSPDKLKKAIGKVKSELGSIEAKKITDEMEASDWKKIEKIFDAFRKECGQTGASKALSLLNPGLFVMWDTGIREELRGTHIYGIGNGEDGKKYVRFLKGVQRIIRDNDLVSRLPKGSNIAKKFDEYNYVRIVKKKKI